MITVEHTGPLVYGGIVTLTKWYDNKRITAGKVASKEIAKLYATWSYLGIGIASLVATVWWRKYQGWTDRLTSGFLYGLPGFIYDTVKATSGTESRGGAVAEAMRIVNAKALGSGRAANRSYEPEFKQAVVF